MNTQTVLGCYQGMMIQSPRSNVVISDMASNKDYLELFDKPIHPWNDIIAEYNKKYAGKNPEQVDAEILANKIKEPQDIHTPNEEIQKALLTPTRTPLESHLMVGSEHIFITPNNDYCGIHNTLDSDGCIICKKERKT